MRGINMLNCAHCRKNEEIKAFEERMKNKFNRSIYNRQCDSLIRRMQFFLLIFLGQFYFAPQRIYWELKGEGHLKLEKVDARNEWWHRHLYEYCFKPRLSKKLLQERADDMGFNQYYVTLFGNWKKVTPKGEI